MSQPRVLIVCDGEAWFIRRVAVTVHDGEKNEMVYRCDQPLGGPFNDVLQAVDALAKIPPEKLV